jgi:hypothetical protein
MLSAREPLVTSETTNLLGVVDRTALLVINLNLTPLLCPFFAKCDGALLINPANDSSEFYPHNGADAKSLCNLLLNLKPQRLICGFIAKPEKSRLRRHGIDVRLGSCSCSIDELVNSFTDLPEA